MLQSGNGVGKTELMATMVLWWLDTRDQAIVLTTGSSWTALTDVLWPRIRALNDKCKVFPPSAMRDMAIRLAPDRFAYAKSTNEPEGVMGAHSPNMLVLVDESSGIEPRIAEGLEGNVIGANDRIVWSGNPISPSGVFFDKAHSPKAHRIIISQFDHPNVRTGENVIPGAVSRAKVEERCAEWGQEVDAGYPGAVHVPWTDRWYKLDHRGMPRIMGLFPEADVASMITRAAINAAKARPPVASEHYCLGIDPAQSEHGDETAFALATANGIIGTEGHVGLKPDEVAGRAKQLALEYGVTTIAIDCSGGYGGGVEAFLRNDPALSHVRLVPVLFGSKSSDDQRWANVKAEMYWLLKEQIERNPYYHLPEDPVLEVQLSEFRSKPNHRGQDAIESKDEYKKRMNGASPDRGEAAALANYGITQRPAKAAVPARYQIG